MDLLIFIFANIKISSEQFSLKYYSIIAVITIESSHFHVCLYKISGEQLSRKYYSIITVTMIESSYFHVCYYKNIKWTIFIKILFNDYSYHDRIFLFSCLLILKYQVNNYHENSIELLYSYHGWIFSFSYLLL